MSPSDDLITSDRPFNSYVITCRYERDRPEICEQRLIIKLSKISDIDSMSLIKSIAI